MQTFPCSKSFEKARPGRNRREIEMRLFASIAFVRKGKNKFIQNLGELGLRELDAGES